MGPYAAESSATAPRRGLREHQTGVAARQGQPDCCRLPRPPNMPYWHLLGRTRWVCFHNLPFQTIGPQLKMRTSHVRVLPD